MLLKIRGFSYQIVVFDFSFFDLFPQNLILLDNLLEFDEIEVNVIVFIALLERSDESCLVIFQVGQLGLVLSDLFP